MVEVDVRPEGVLTYRLDRDKLRFARGSVNAATSC
jgi:hypothetical protein